MTHPVARQSLPVASQPLEAPPPNMTTVDFLIFGYRVEGAARVWASRDVSRVTLKHLARGDGLSWIDLAASMSSCDQTAGADHLDAMSHLLAKWKDQP